jgi:hypothetical protein
LKLRVQSNTSGKVQCWAKLLSGRVKTIFAAQSAGMSSCGLPVGLASRRKIFAACSFIVLATLAAYLNSFSGSFIFDDQGSITENPTIRHLWPIWIPLSPPHNSMTSAAPVDALIWPLVQTGFSRNHVVGRHERGNQQ